MLKKIFLLISACIITGVFCSCTINYDYLVNNEEFDADTWKAQTDKRYYMVEDLTENYLYIGMPRDEVLELIGEPFNVFDEPELLAYWYDCGNYFPGRQLVLQVEFVDDALSRTTYFGNF